MRQKLLGTLICCLFCWIRYVAAEIYAINVESHFYFEEFEDLPALFGRKISDGVVRGLLVYADPPDGCTDALKPPPNDENDTGKWIVLIPRYNNLTNCSFEQKVRTAQNANYDAVIVHNVNSNQLVPMSAKNSTGIEIPAVFVSEQSGLLLKNVYATAQYFIVITGESPFNIQTHLLIPFAIVVGICFIVMIIFMIVKCVRDRRRQRRHRLPTSTLSKIPTCKYQKGDPYETCAICLDDYVEGEKLRVLPCNHVYHSKCIDPWLTKNRRVCPICKRKVFAHDEPHEHDTDSESDADDTTPLIQPGNVRQQNVTQGGTFQQQNENPIQRAARSISQQSNVATLITASDHHSINGDYQSCTSSMDSSLIGVGGGGGGGGNNRNNNCDLDVVRVQVNNEAPDEQDEEEIGEAITTMMEEEEDKDDDIDAIEVTIEGATNSSSNNYDNDSNDSTDNRSVRV